MRHRKLYLIMDRLTVVLFNILLLVMVLWATIIPIAKSPSFYLNQYEKHNTAEKSGYSKEELIIITDTIIAYLFDDIDDMQVEIEGDIVFSNQALIHMADVKELFTQGQNLAWLLLCFMVLVIVYIHLRFAYVKKHLFKYSVITISTVLGLLLIIGIMALIDFYFVFEMFHHIIFPDEIKFRDAFFGVESHYPEVEGINNLTLIIILSMGLFTNIAIIIGVVIAFVLLVWFSILLIYRKKLKRGVV